MIKHHNIRKSSANAHPARPSILQTLLFFLRKESRTMATNIYFLFTKLLIILALPSPILPFMMTLLAATATYTRPNTPFLQIISSTFRNEALSVGGILALLWIALLASRLILSKIQLYLESLLHLISPIKLWTCFTFYIIAVVVQLSAQRFHSSLNQCKVLVPANFSHGLIFRIKLQRRVRVPTTKSIQQSENGSILSLCRLLATRLWSPNRDLNLPLPHRFVKPDRRYHQLHVNLLEPGTPTHFTTLPWSSCFRRR